MVDNATVGTTKAYKRVLVKLSGEALQGDHLFGIDASRLARVAQEIANAVGSNA